MLVYKQSQSAKEKLTHERVGVAHQMNIYVYVMVHGGHFHDVPFACLRRQGEMRCTESSNDGIDKLKAICVLAGNFVPLLISPLHAPLLSPREKFTLTYCCLKRNSRSLFLISPSRTENSKLLCMDIFVERVKLIRRLFSILQADRACNVPQPRKTPYSRVASAASMQLTAFGFRRRADPAPNGNLPGSTSSYHCSPNHVPPTPPMEQTPKPPKNRFGFQLSPRATAVLNNINAQVGYGYKLKLIIINDLILLWSSVKEKLKAIFVLLKKNCIKIMQIIIFV